MPAPPPLDPDRVSGPARHGDTEVAAVVVPVKAFTAAKGRLAEALDTAERAALARRSATAVVRAAGALPVWVVCDDDEVAAWAEAAGAAVLWRPARGLNGSVQDAVHHLGLRGVDRVVVAHADLPLADDLTVVLGADGVTLVPDRHDDGTNVASVPTRRGFRFAYGPGSFARHRVEARRTGLPCRVVRVASLAWDVDVPADLDLPELASWDP